MHDHSEERRPHGRAPLGSARCPRSGRPRGHADGAARGLHRRRARRVRLRGRAAADRGRPDHLAAVHRRADDRGPGAASPHHRVLEIGTGSGYAAAVLCRIAAEVYTVERHDELALAAERRLRALGYDNVHVRHGDGTLGWAEHAPYDAIVVAAGGPDDPAPAARAARRRRPAGHPDRADAARAGAGARAARRGAQSTRARSSGRCASCR